MTDNVHRAYGATKAATIGAMEGTVVEIGPGIGANMRYFGPNVRLIAIEPNPHLHQQLRQAAAEHSVDMELWKSGAERIDLADDSVDAVVGTLVLCGVEDPDSAVAEVRRVLKPGGTYFFVEHVAAPPRTLTRHVQRSFKAPHRWVANGCEVDRDTEAIIGRAGFASVSIDHRDGGLGDLYVRHQICGTATAS